VLIFEKERKGKGGAFLGKKPKKKGITLSLESKVMKKIKGIKRKSKGKEGLTQLNKGEGGILGNR